MRTLLRLSLPFSAIEKVFFVCLALRGYRNTLDFSFEEAHFPALRIFLPFALDLPSAERESGLQAQVLSPNKSRTEREREMRNVKSTKASSFRFFPNFAPKKIQKKSTSSSEFLTRKHTADTTLSLSLSLSMLFAHERRVFLFRKEERRR